MTDADKLAGIERRQGWLAIMGSPQSRRVMWEQFEVMGIYQVAQSVEPCALAFNEGRRSLALQVMHEILAHCPELYDRMIVENRARLRLEQAEANKGNDQ